MVMCAGWLHPHDLMTDIPSPAAYLSTVNMGRLSGVGPSPALHLLTRRLASSASSPAQQS